MEYKRAGRISLQQELASEFPIPKILCPTFQSLLRLAMTLRLQQIAADALVVA
jgi:hypothetical protein